MRIHRDSTPRSAIALALGAAGLFGLSTPAAKLLLAVSDPWLLAGLLYLGSGVGLGAIHLGRHLSGAPRATPLARADWPWLAGAIAAGGGVGPVLLMLGLAAGHASATALLLNLEGVLTALLAWFVFREHVDRRIALGMAAITVGALVLAWDGARGVRLERSALLVAGACAAWALDNNLTRKVSASDPLRIAALKGLVAGAVNTAIALALGAARPEARAVAGAALVGLLGYGVSLVLFVLALRHLGAGRTGAYFSTAPFVGALAGVVPRGDTDRHAARDVDEWLPQTVLAVKPAVATAEDRQVILVAEEITRGERSFGHRDSLHGLLIVRRLLLPAGIPTLVPDRPEDSLGSRLMVEEGKRCSCYVKEVLLRPATSGDEQGVRQHRVRIGHARLEPLPVRPSGTIAAFG